jgi:hypothetical protein
MELSLMQGQRSRAKGPHSRVVIVHQRKDEPVKRDVWTPGRERHTPTIPLRNYFIFVRIPSQNFIQILFLNLLSNEERTALITRITT